jgi:hypothetical protein
MGYGFSLRFLGTSNVTEGTVTAFSWNKMGNSAVNTKVIIVKLESKNSYAVFQKRRIPN